MKVKNKAVKLLGVLLTYKALKKLFIWWSRVRFFRLQNHVVPVASEFAATPWEVLYNFATNSHRQHDFRLEVLNKYTNNLKGPNKSVTGCGMMFNFSPLVLTVDEAVMQHILKDKFNNYLRLDMGLELVFGRSLLTVNHGPFASDKGEFYKYQRKTSSKLFTDNKLKGMIASSLTCHINALTQRLTEHINSNATDGFGMKENIYTLTFDVICEIGFGYKYKNKKEEMMYQDAFDDLFDLLPNQMRDPSWMLPFSEHYIPSKKRLIRARDLLADLYAKVIDVRLEEDVAIRANRGDLLSLFMNSSADNRYNKEQLRDLMFLFVSAGRDTAATTMQWLAYHLAIDSQLQDHLYNESLQFVGWNKSTGDLSIDVEKMRSNMFLDGVVMEALRMYPPFSFNGKVAAQDDILPNGLHVKAGTAVLYDAHAMGRDPTKYKCANTFMPSRWMGTSRKPETMNEYALPVFLGGNRICIGKSLAMQEMKLLLVHLVCKFKFSLHPDEVDSLKKRDVLYNDSTFYVYADELRINAEKRVSRA